MSRAKIWVLFCALVLVQRTQLNCCEKKKKVQPIIRGGKKLMIVKETLNFPKMVEVCERG